MFTNLDEKSEVDPIELSAKSKVVPFKRTQFIVNHSVQWPIILTFTFTPILSVFLWNCMHLYLEQELTSLFNIFFVLFSMTIGFLLSAWGLLLSNRIAGPIYRLGKILEENSDKQNINDLDLDKLHIRCDDCFHEFRLKLSTFIKSKQDLKN